LKFHLILLMLFFIFLPVFSNTLLVDRVDSQDSADFVDSDLEQIRAMENGVIDLCFDSGIMVFNTQSRANNLEDGKSNALEFAEQNGVTHLLRIQALLGDKKMTFRLYSVTDQDMLLSGEWLQDSWIGGETQSLQEFYYQAGKLTAEQLIPLL
jgi:hypothetical protein